jgi:DNA-binding response OmpR family regulator
MSMEEKDIVCALAGKRILVVEDDRYLSQHIAELLERYTGNIVVRLNSVQGAQVAVKNESSSIALAIVDVMLPNTEKDYETICALEKQLESIRTKLAQIDPQPKTDNDMQRLADARMDRRHILSVIHGLTNKMAGIELVEMWRAHGPECVRNAAIVFLAALGSPDVVTAGLKAAQGGAEWLVKPVSSDALIERCVRIVRQMERKG